MAWDPAKHPRGPNGRFVKVGAALNAARQPDRASLSDAVLGTAARGPKRQREPARFGKVGAALASAKADSSAPARRISPETKRTALATLKPKRDWKADAAARMQLAKDRANEPPAFGPQPTAAELNAREREVREAMRGGAHLGGGAKEQPTVAKQNPVKAARFKAKSSSGSPTAAQSDADVAAYEKLGRPALLKLARSVDINPRGKGDNELAKALAAMDEQNRLKREGRLPAVGDLTAIRNFDLGPTPFSRRDFEQRVAAAQADIRTAVQRLEDRPGEWVSLEQIRNELGERHNRHVVNEALRLLNRESDISLVPESNQKTLTPSQRDAAVHIGGQDKHLIMIERTSAHRQLVAALHAATSRDAARDALKGLTVAELRQVAKATGATIGANYRKARVLEEIVNWAVGRRLDSAAIQRMARER